MNARRIRRDLEYGMSLPAYRRSVPAAPSGRGWSLADQAPPVCQSPAIRLGTPAGRHLVALDLDGTTVNHLGRPSPAVIGSVRAVRAAGHEVVVATGRSLVSTLPILRELDLRHGFAVCSNGAVTLRLDPDHPQGYETLETVTFNPGPVLAALREAWPQAHVAVEDFGVGFRVNAPFPELELDGHVQVVPWQELASGETTRVTFRSVTATAEDFVQLTEGLGLHGVNYAVGYTAWLDITPEGTSKASALEQVRARLDIEADRTVAVGDQRNDIEMLRWAACGVAMGGAPAEVRAAADSFTTSVYEDGLVPVLRALPPV